MSSEVSPQPIAYGVKDAAAAIGLSRSRIWQLIGEGEIEARKLGGRTVIPAASLNAYLNSAPQRQPAKAAA